MVAVAINAFEAIWLRRMLEILQHEQDSPTKILCDSKSTIELTKNPVFYACNKHIDIKFHFIRQLIQMRSSLIITRQKIKQLMSLQNYSI